MVAVARERAEVQSEAEVSSRQREWEAEVAGRLKAGRSSTTAGPRYRRAGSCRISSNLCVMRWKIRPS